MIIGQNYFTSINKLLRTHHWIKNLFIFLPLFFAQGFGNIQDVINLVLAFFSFSFVASSIYILNDLKDVEKDKAHPTKKNRPIASGKISPKTAKYFFILTLTLSVIFGLASHNHNVLLLVIAIYFIQNIAYTYYLKNIAIIDVIVISVGFVLRLFAGAVVTGVSLSFWIILMTFLLSLFLGFAKRRDDVLIHSKEGTKSRANIGRYNEKFIDSVLTLTATITIVCYIMYCISPEVQLRMGTDKLYITSIFVIVGIIRYLQSTLVDENSGSPTKMLLKDRFLQLVILGWITTFAFLIYFYEK